MIIKEGDLFEVQDGGKIQIKHIDINRVTFQYIQGSSKTGEIHRETFEQFRMNGYFKAVE
jgi:GTP cyclohydrolase III